jgi:hypothetical protein
MSLRSSRHRAVLEELTEWWEDVRDSGIGSRVVLAPVPPGWGASAVLDGFRELVEDPAGPVTITISVGDVPLASRAIEAGALRDELMTPFVRSRAAELLGLDKASGDVQLGLGIGGLFASGLAVTVPLLMGSLLAAVTENWWDNRPAGQQGMVARAARLVAAVSTAAPVAVIIDDADRLDPGLAVTMIENLASRYDGRVLVVAVVGLESTLAAELRSPDRYGLLGRVQKADIDLDMDDEARASVAREMCPWLSDELIHRIVRRTQTFTEVFAVATSDRLAELAGASGPSVREAVDAVINAKRMREEVSVQAGVLGWAGGTVTIRQADRALQVLGADAQHNDPWVIRSGGLARLSDPVSPRVAEYIAAMSKHDRCQLAAVMLEEAVGIARNPEATLVERVVARLTAHRVRADLGTRNGLTETQCLLIRGLERLGDPDAARQIANEALAELPEDTQASERAGLLKAALRLARPDEDKDEDPVIREAVTLATTGGAILGLEARVWAAVNVLRRPSQRESALTLAEQVTGELARMPGRDEAANQWRVLLAFHLGQAGHSALSRQLLNPVISSGTTGQQEAAQAVLRALDAPQADTQLQIIILEAELAVTPPGAEDDLLRLHHALARDYSDLGDYPSALRHGTDQLQLSLRLLGPGHPQTLLTRQWCAWWTFTCGYRGEALRLLRDLVPDLIRVFGPDHEGVLSTRDLIERCIGESGDSAEALRLSLELLPDLIRTLGPDHRGVLSGRAHIARWTGECGDSAQALQLYLELLPDQMRLLGSNHPDVLDTRGSIAFWVNACGDSAQAMRLSQELLLDQIRILGRGHPDVLITRNNVAGWTYESGDAAASLRLFRELLPDMIHALGRDHPSVLTVRSNVVGLTDKCGDRTEALELSQKLLPDLIRVLGPDHPLTLATRSKIADWTS